MMKFKILALLLLVSSFSPEVTSASQNVPMQIIDEDGVGNGHTYAPARPWYIIQDDYVLTLPAFEDDFTLELRDATDSVVYSTYLPAGTTQVVLPSTLSGSFELRLVPFFATYYYRGYLSL